MTFQEFLTENNIDPNVHYFFQMRPLEIIWTPWTGYLAAYTSSDSPELWVECELVDSLYGKVELHALDARFGTEKFYRDDFLSFIKRGIIVPKVDDAIKPTTITWIEPLCGAAYLVHNKNVIVDRAGTIISYNKWQE